MSSLFSDLNRKYHQNSIDLVITDAFLALDQNIDNILECPPRSFMFNRGFGARLRSFLFEPMNDQTAMEIKISLIKAIEQWEPRIYVNMRNTYVIPDYDNNTYYVSILYVVRSNNQIRQYERSLPTMVGN
jgi:phage baseplate assembly protein W